MSQDNQDKNKKQQKRPAGTESWLTVKAYALKYGISMATVREWQLKGYLTSKSFKGNSKKQVLIPDLPPEDHPDFIKKGVNPRARKLKTTLHTNKYTINPELAARKRKESLVPFLKLFLEKSKPDQMFFTGPELMKMLDLRSTRLYKSWKEWGLETHPMPNGRKDERVYSRAAIYKFLSGKWTVSENIKPSLDDKILDHALGGPEKMTDGFYHYNRFNAYPMNGEGFLAWLDDKKIMLQDKTLRQWMPFRPLGFQRKFFKEALKQNAKGNFVYNLIIACWERGEGKTLCIALIVIFRFFNGFEEVINLASESKDLASFIHYNLIKKIILNTPALKNTPGLDVKEKEIVLMRRKNDPACIMKAVPSSSGLLPGTTVAVFSELHKIKNRDFFIDFWTSTRATPNAMTLVDTTVAKKGHLVYSLWETHCRKEDPLLLFDHKSDDIQNPETTDEQLASFRRQMLSHEFDMYFRNRWEDATGGLFTVEGIKKISYVGVKTGSKITYGTSDDLNSAVHELFELEEKKKILRQQNVENAHIDNMIALLNRRLIKTDELYTIPADMNDIRKLEGVFGVNFMIGVGLDRSKLLGEKHDRTALVCIARGVVDEYTSYRFLLDVFIPQKATFHFLQDKLLEWQNKYGWITKVVAEDYQAQDFHLWCVEHGLEAELLHATQKNKELIFTNLYQQIEEGHFKSPAVPYYTDDEGNTYQGYSNKPDILREELGVFIGDAESRLFGSPDKRKKGSIKDDIVYGTAWASFACEGENIADLHALAKEKQNAPIVYLNPDVIGDYGI